MASPTLTDELTRALELLGNVTKKAPDAGPLTPELLAEAKALQFVHTNKTGLGLGVTTGFGFSIAKLGTAEGGAATWSAPCFLLVGGLSLGATVGTQEAGSLSCVLSDRAAEHLLSAGALQPGSLGAEANLTVLNILGMHGTKELVGPRDVVTLGWADGLLADISASVGALKVDAAKNRAVYGREIEPREILGGGPTAVPPPPQFEALYLRLNEVMLPGQAS